MSSIVKVILLLAVMVCVSVAQMNEPGQQCLCQRTRNKFPAKSEVKDVQIYPATIFCDKVEIVVTTNNNFRFCLNPKLNAVRKLLNTIISRRKQITSSTAQPTKLTSSPVSTNTARM